MPAQPAWFHRLEEIQAELRDFPAPFLDRHAVERLFGVQERRARQLMSGLPSIQVGNAVAVPREALLAKLQAAADSTEFQRERRRRGRLASKLETLRRHAEARKVSVPAPPQIRDSIVSRLSEGIHLAPGQLRIEFRGAEELAAKLFELSQAMANDWQGIQEAVQDGAQVLDI